MVEAVAVVKPGPFDLVQPRSLADAVAALRADDARVIAGGQTLLPMLGLRVAQLGTLVDISKVPDLDRIDVGRREVRVGAAVRQRALERHEAAMAAQPLLARMLPWIAHVQVRSRGTVCGSIAHADPASELPLALALLDGTVHLRGRRRRDVAARQFFVAPMTTAIRTGELIEAVSFPVAAPDEACAFAEFGRRRGDYAVVACAALRRGRRLWLGIGGVGDTPIIREVDRADDEELNAIAWTCGARDDPQATARLRRHLVRNLGARVLAEVRR